MVFDCCCCDHHDVTEFKAVSFREHSDGGLSPSFSYPFSFSSFSLDVDRRSFFVFFESLVDISFL